MAFTIALHYPWIEIQDPGWVKKAALYWDKIHTIVPESISEPYKSATARALQDEGILKPFFVQPHMDVVYAASATFSEYVHTREGRYLLRPLPSFTRNRTRLDEYTGNTALLHPEKIDINMLQQLLITGVAKWEGEWLRINQRIENYYMTILATYIAQEFGFALLANKEIYDNLAGHVRRQDCAIDAIMETQMLEALLAKVILQVVNINSSTPINKIIKFRRKYQDELSRFRIEVSNLISQIETIPNTPEALRQILQDTYKNQIIPAQNDLESSLKSMKINYVIESLKTTIFVSPGYFISENLFKSALNEYSTFAAAVTTLTVGFALQRVTYLNDRRTYLRQNPYSYVFAAKKQFGVRKTNTFELG